MAHGNSLYHLLWMHSLYGIDEIFGEVISAKAHSTSSIDSCNTLSKLYEHMLSFDGCALKETATNTVFADGNPKSDIMVIGEAPGADEDAVGKPFVGASGKLLDKMFAAIGLSRQDNLYISNIIPWRPPFNRNPSPEEIDACLPLIEKHIELIAPKIIVLVGGIACKALLRTTDGISKVRGRLVEYKNLASGACVPAFAIYHPAYLLRSPGQKRQAWDDLKALRDIISDL